MTYSTTKQLPSIIISSTSFITPNTTTLWRRTSLLPCTKLCYTKHYSPQSYRQNTLSHSISIQCMSTNSNNNNNGGEFNSMEDENSNSQSISGDDLWSDALQGLLIEALRTYYQGSPLFSEAEFNTLRDELDHLGISQLRLANMEKVWMQASSSRDFDNHIRREFDLTEEDLRQLKNTLLVKNLCDRPTLPIQKDYVADAKQLKASENVNERLKWFLFSHASEERFKIMLLYLPAVLMSFITASVLTILFALLDGEMQIYITTAGRFRLGILSYIVVMLTFWFSNQVTPTMMNYLDLGQPTLIRGDCPICAAPISCLFTGAARVRDERKCSVCGATVGFNRRWTKTYLVSPPGKPFQSPD